MKLVRIDGNEAVFEHDEQRISCQLGDTSTGQRRAYEVVLAMSKAKREFGFADGLVTDEMIQQAYPLVHAWNKELA